MEKAAIFTGSAGDFVLPENPRKVLVLHGPNLNMLGVREPRHYGRQSLPEIDEQLVTEGTRLGVEVTTFQNNAEHYLIDKVHAAYNQYHFLIINPAALTHTSVALRDAIAAVDLPFIEVHLSNVHAREPFRRHSYFSDIAVGVISGLGGKGYLLALHGAMDFLDSHHRQE